jgi:hypothetical protein
VHEHLFVFFEPGIHRCPVESDCAAEPRDGGVGEQPGCAGAVDLADSQRMGLGCAAPGLLGVALRGKKVAAHVGERGM